MVQNVRLVCVGPEIPPQTHGSSPSPELGQKWILADLVLPTYSASVHIPRLLLCLLCGDSAVAHGDAITHMSPRVLAHRRNLATALGLGLLSPNSQQRRDGASGKILGWR